MIYEIDELKEMLKTACVSYDAFITAIDHYAFEVLSKAHIELIDLILMYFDDTLEDTLLQGEPDWLAYSEHGNSLVIDESIAVRFGSNAGSGFSPCMRSLQVAVLERTPSYLHARAIYYYTHNN